MKTHDLGNGVTARIDADNKLIVISQDGFDSSILIPLEAMIRLLLEYLRARHAALDPNKVDF